MAEDRRDWADIEAARMLAAEHGCTEAEVLRWESSHEVELADVRDALVRGMQFGYARRIAEAKRMRESQPTHAIGCDLDADCHCLEALEFNPDELALLRECIDSHIYWQLATEFYREQGFVVEPGSDDAEARDEIERCRALLGRLGVGWDWFERG